MPPLVSQPRAYPNHLELWLDRLSNYYLAGVELAVKTGREVQLRRVVYSTTVFKPRLEGLR